MPNWYDIPEPSLEPPDPAPYPCPICGERCPEYLVRDWMGDIVGCNVCTDEVLPESYDNT